MGEFRIGNRIGKTTPELQGVVNENMILNTNVLYFLYAVLKNNSKHGCTKFAYSVYPVGYKNRVLDNYEYGIEVVMLSWDSLYFVFRDDGVFKAPYLENQIRSFGGCLKLEYLCDYGFIKKAIASTDIASLCAEFLGF